MKHLYVLILIILLCSCKEKCEVCEVLKNEQMIEKYESCDTEGIKVSKSICEEMAKLQDSKCECYKKDKARIEKKAKVGMLTTVEEAREYVAESFSSKEETLLISDELNDPIGMNMALIGDVILKKDYMPNGFEQKDGYRIYKYRKD